MTSKTDKYGCYEDNKKIRSLTNEPEHRRAE